MSTYSFRAERMNIGVSGINNSQVLEPNAQNLASVLLQLPSNPDAHDRYNEYVREIFPTIYKVVSRPNSVNTTEIIVIMNDLSGGRSRAGIDVPLIDSGTGISQVLAMLYVAVVASSPRIILIDEPNSFLHPGAAKKLLNILRRLGHQYVISTHSSEIIRAADPDYLHLLEWEDTKIGIRSLDRGSVLDQRQVLEELGVSLSDLFGADHVLWVEGQTEYHCFPLLLSHLKLFNGSIAIAPIVATGDLEGRRAKSNLIWQIYERLSGGVGLIPPLLAFSLDSEDRSQAEIADMRRRSKAAVKFLPARTFENFLLNPAAIAAVLADEIKETAVPEARAVAAWIEMARQDGRYHDFASKNICEEKSWHYKINAPKLLKDLFWDMSKIEYRKVVHSVALTKWLLEHNPDNLQELLDYVSDLISSGTSPHHP